MSDSQKQQRTGATPIKNPLLSASVTGLTLDDFPNKPYLLPAAPPVVHTTTSIPSLNVSGLVGREQKSLVTVGTSSLDTENLDEINLNSSNEDSQTSGIIDTNANPLLEQPNQSPNTDSILSQAASSFSALPSVASNVLSTFSKRINAISSRESTPIADQYQQDNNSNALTPQLDIQPAYIQQSRQVDSSSQAPPPFYATPFTDNPLSNNFGAACQATQTSLAVAEPPKFYTPAEVPTIPPPITGAVPTVAGGQNNFRFSSKKKLYAPIPGLSDQNRISTTTLDPASVSGSISFDTPNPYYTPTTYHSSETQKPDSGGLFSKITNLAPSGVLQNITDLVQTAAGSLTQPNKSDFYEDTTSSNSVFDQQNNSILATAPFTNYFLPQHPTNSALASTAANPNLVQNIKSPSVLSDQQSSSSQLVNIQTINRETSGNLLQIQPHTQIKPVFDSSSVQLLQYSGPPSNLSCPQNPSTDQPAKEQVNFFDPKKYLPPNSQTSPTPSSVPTAAAHKIPPQASGQTSYRLQKGTKLYKSPLTPQETAPIPATLNQIQQSFVSHQSVPLFTPPPIGQQSYLPSVSTSEPLLIPSQASVSSFFAAQTPTTLSKQNSPLYATCIETSQSIVPSAASQSNLSILDPSITSNKGDPFNVATLEDLNCYKNPPTTSQVSFQTGAPLTAPPSVVISQPAQVIASKVEESKENKTLQSESLFDPTNNLFEHFSNNNSQKQELNPEGKPTVLFEPPLKKLKSEGSANENKNDEELLTSNAPEQKINPESEDPLEIFEQHFLAYVPKIDQKLDNETQVILESIEPVFEPNITAIKEGEKVDLLEETLQKLSLKVVEAKAVNLPPIGESFNLKNPYRKGCNTETAKPAPILPTLANFFTPDLSAAASSDNLNFFTSLSSTQSSSNEVNFFSETKPIKADNTEILEANKSEKTEPINFFTKPFTIELAPLEPQTIVEPPISAFFPAGSVPAILEDSKGLKDHLKESFDQGNLPPPKGFENIEKLEPTIVILPDNTTETLPKTTFQQEITLESRQPEIVNRFTNYFNQTNPQPEIAKDPLKFFDSFCGSPQQQQQQLEGTTSSSVATNEEQRIQYFFNNPPPKDASDVGDLNYDLVHSGLGIKNLQQRSLTPVSNLVEPPSSAGSEFSEISTLTAAQKALPANLSITEASDKSFEIDESFKPNTEKDPASIPLGSNVKLYGDLPEEILKELRMANMLSADKATTSPVASVSYKPAVKHWFFKRTINDKPVWVPFSHYDSALLETSLLMEADENSNIAAVEGGRYDVNINERRKMSVYWESPPIEVRRCSWFYKAVDSKYVPYEEQTAEVLEKEYKQAAESGVWHKTIILGMGEQVVFHGPTVIVHFQQQQNADAWGGTTQTATRPRVVKRDLDDFIIEQGESQKVDHLLFMVHGIGSACDLKLRSVEEVVEDFRTIARQLVQSHYKNSTDLGLVGRVEVLPISWHSHLHSAEMGIDKKLRMITLESIPKLRNFTNDTLLDILFYTSPTFCQKIMNTIVSSMNTLYLKYRARHPEFNGGVSLAGHSLGSLILFDLLCHQNPIKESEDTNVESPDKLLAPMDSNQLEDNQMSYTMGPAGTGQPFIHYNQLIFQPKKFFALGSPIGMFVTIRGIDKLGLDFRLPTCTGFYNIFHPYDPVAYRIEALVNPDLSDVRPVLISHHKGRKRMHLELKETMARVSMDLKNRFLDKFKTTLDSVNIFGSSSKSTKEAEELMEKEVDKVIQMQMQLEHQNHNRNLASGSDCPNESVITSRQRTDSVSTAMSDDAVEIDFPLGKLNDSKRIDYVLQEAPLEFINEYIFALSSHVCYWDSEDTILFVMKEIYSGLGISPDSQVPQQTMTIERPSSRNSLIS